MYVFLCLFYMSHRRYSNCRPLSSARYNRIICQTVENTSFLERLSCILHALAKGYQGYKSNSDFTFLSTAKSGKSRIQNPFLDWPKGTHPYLDESPRLEQTLSPPQRLPLGIPIKISIIEKIESAREYKEASAEKRGTNRKRQGTSAIQMSHVYQNCQRAKGLAWTAWMKIQSIVAINISFLKTHRDSRILHSRTAKKTWQIMWRKRIFSDSRRNYCEFGFSVQLQK